MREYQITYVVVHMCKFFFTYSSRFCSQVICMYIHASACVWTCISANKRGYMHAHMSQKSNLYLMSAYVFGTQLGPARTERQPHISEHNAETATHTHIASGITERLSCIP